MDKILPYIQAFAIPALAAAGGWIAYMFTKQSKRDEVREKRRLELEEIEHKRKVAAELLVAMKQNSLDAVRAVEQLYPNLSGPEKARLAIERADQLNEILGVKQVLGNKPPAAVMQTYNESNVLTLPEKPKGEG